MSQQVGFDPNDPKWANMAAQQNQGGGSNRWSYHLANNPWGSYGEQYAKQWYDDPNLADPGAKMQEHLQSYRSQWGDAAPEDDASLMQMIASGQAPSVTSPKITSGQYPVSQYTDQLSTIQGTPRNKELYDLLLGRATQTKAIDRNDPIIRAQADAYAANEERARRNYLSDIAEKMGPTANLQGEARMAAERMGQRTGSFEAELLGRELTARRQEIAQALAQMGDMLGDNERLALQRELSLIDSAIRQQLGMSDIGVRMGQLDLERALGMGRLGLDAEQQASYWDWLRQGGRF